MPCDDPINRKQFPQLDLICWHMGDNALISRKEAFLLYEANWRYVEVNDLSDNERRLIAQLAIEYGQGMFAPKGGQPIELPGVTCV